MPKGSPERTMIIDAYTGGLGVLWAVMAGLAFLALVLSAWTEGLDLNKQQVSEQGLRVSEDRGELLHTGNSSSAPSIQLSLMPEEPNAGITH